MIHSSGGIVSARAIEGKERAPHKGADNAAYKVSEKSCINTVCSCEDCMKIS